MNKRLKLSKKLNTLIAQYQARRANDTHRKKYCLDSFAVSENKGSQLSNLRNRISALRIEIRNLIQDESK